MKTQHRLSGVVGVVAAVLWGSVAAANVTVPAIFGENMVLQRSAKTAVWGRADAGEPVTVTLENGVDSVKESTTAGADGRWRVNLNLGTFPAKATTLTIRGKNQLLFSNVVVGQVWLCGGQSNMEFTVARGNYAAEEVEHSADPMLRHFQVRKRISAAPSEELEGSWVVASPETTGKFTAVGYYFARELRQKLDLPVGLINDNWGGTPAEAWTSVETLEKHDALKELGAIARMNARGELEPKRRAAYAERVAAWERASTQPTEPGKKPSSRPAEPAALNQNSPAALYNGMILPIMPMTLAGVIWYQGESNVGRGVQYRTLLTEMIGDWRRGFENAELPFFIVQLANYHSLKKEPGDDPWAEVRDAQRQVANDVKNSGLAVIYDIGEAGDIHPKNKQDVGHRLALQARRKVYGERDLVASGPVYESMDVHGREVKLHFRAVGGGLQAKGPMLAGFQVCGEDRKWVWADARIEGENVIVSGAGVDKPVAVRYGWANNVVATLYNAEGLPAGPFRTDEFPLLSDRKPGEGGGPR